MTLLYDIILSLYCVCIYIRFNMVFSFSFNFMCAGRVQSGYDSTKFIRIGQSGKSFSECEWSTSISMYWWFEPTRNTINTFFGCGYLCKLSKRWDRIKDICLQMLKWMYVCIFVCICMYNTWYYLVMWYLYACTQNSYDYLSIFPPLFDINLTNYNYTVSRIQMDIKRS